MDKFIINFNKKAIKFEDKWFITPFQKYIWTKKYKALTDNNVEDTWRRVAKALSLNDKQLEKELFDALYGFKTTFGGRIIANIGRNDITNATLMNCYGSQGIKGYDVDSIEGIYDELKFAAKTLTSEGGWGVNLSFIRPKGTIIRGTGIVSPGIIKFAELFDKSAEVIVNDYNTEVYQGKRKKKESRKGAQMLVVEIWHNDIIDFINAKQISGRLTHFNISVGIRDDFMKILEENPNSYYLEYRDNNGNIKTIEYLDNNYIIQNNNIMNKEYYNKLREQFPKIEGYKLFDIRKGKTWKLKYPLIKDEHYKKEWDGDIYKWQYTNEYPVFIYKEIDADKIWDIIMKATYNRNEPGIMFIDNMDKDNNLYILGEKITGTNPCGEIPVAGRLKKYKDIVYGGDNCNLGSINLPRLIKKDNDSYVFDFELLKKVTASMIKGLDNVIDITTYPHEYYKHAAHLRRKVGLGIMGLGSLFYILNIRYGSKESIELFEKILKIMVNTAYKTSALLAKEKGPFPLYIPDIINNGFIKRAINENIFTEDTINAIKKYGLRNSQLLSIAPTGSTALYTGISSGGHEPVFNKEYVRWYRIFQKETPYKNEKIPDITKGEWFETNSFFKTKEGDEEILLSKCGNYKIEKTRGLVAKEIVKDYGYYFIQKHNLKINPDVLVGAQELNLKEHLAIHTIAAKYIDQSVSKTINLPNDFSLKDFKKLFYSFWKKGGKGLTTYRDGTMTKVLETIEKANDKVNNLTKTEIEKIFKKYENKIIPKDLKIPLELPSKMIKTKAENKKWYFHVVYVDNELTKPFAIFIQTNHKEPIKYRDVLIFELLEFAKKIGIDKDIIYKHIDKMEGSKTNKTDKLARTVSLLLRHNVKLIDIISIIENIGAPIGSVVYQLKHILIKHLPNKKTQTNLVCSECGAKLVLESGCYICPQCGHSKCS